MSIGAAVPDQHGGVPLRTRGILWQALGPLLLGSALVIAIAGWAIYGVATSALEAETLARIRRQAEDRQAREQPRFTLVGERVQTVAALLARRWSGPAQPQPAATVSGFIGPAAAEDPGQRRAFALATGLMAEAGDLLAGEGGSLVVAMPGAWLTGHGPGIADLVDAMLPDDPVLMPAEREAIAGASALAWTRPFLEPASGRWQVSAIARSDLAGLGRAAAAQSFGLDELLSRLAARATEEVHMAWDRHGRLLVRSSAPSGAPPVAERAADDPVAGPIAAAAPWSADPTEVVAMPAGWIAVSRIAGPDITMATWYPRHRLATGQRQVAVLALAGCVMLLAVQSLLLWLVLRRRVGRPLQELGAAARTLADGGTISLGTARRDELGDLARSFARMADAIVAREAALRDSAEALRDRQQLLRAVLDGAADGVLVLDDDRIVEANPRAEAQFGFSRDQLIGRRPQDLSPDLQPDGSPTAQEVRRRMDMLAVHGRQHFPWRHRRADGTEFDAEIGLARIQGPGRDLAVAMVRDVTERNRIEARLREGERMESLGRLAGGVAHDVNNMLAGILGCAELLRRPATDDGRRLRLTDTIITACERAAGLTRRLLTFSRRGAGPLATADLHGLVREAVAMLPAAGGGLRTVLRLDAPRPWILCDPAQVQNAILNLAINARDAMPAGGELRITTRTLHLDAAAASRFTPPPPTGEHVLVEVADTGSGIPPEILSRIFEPFFTTKPAGRGTGLGLAAVYGTVAGMHGGITVASRAGEGTVFTIVLPLAEPPPGRAAPPPAPPEAGPRGVLLLVDDDTAARTVCAQLLSEGGWEVVEAEDGALGAAAFAREPDRFAAVLLDMEMPVLRGDECLRRIRSVRPGIPALLISGFVGDVDDPEGPLAGFDGLVRKPFRLSELQEALDGLRARR